MRNWFDELAKAAGKGVSRRDSIRRMGAGLLGAFAVAFGAGRASAESVYTEGCKLKCKEAGRADEAFAACVSDCIDCAEGTALNEPGGSIVCSAGVTGLACCSGSYRTCKRAATKKYAECESF